MERIGIYGGTFNPPHMGHIRAAEYAVSTLQLDRLLVIPSCISPHKQMPQGSPSGQQRLQMLKLAFANSPKIEVSDAELRRGDVSYTWQTVEALRQQYPQAELLLFMGTDMFLSFDTWKNPDRILQNAALAVFYRGENKEQNTILEKKQFFEEKGAKIYLAENPVTEISSTDLRRMLIFRCADPFLHPAVADFIQANGLYSTLENYQNLPVEELERVVTGLLKENRVRHVLGCSHTAVELAQLYGADPVDARRAGLLHDITKALDGPLQLTLCREYGITLDGFSLQNPKTLHALTGSLVARRIFGENDAVVSAIESHTTGKANMNTLEKIIYVADYMEPNRDFDGVEELRRLAYTDLDKALEHGLRMTLQMLERQGRQISENSREALRFLERQRK